MADYPAVHTYSAPFIAWKDIGFTIWFVQDNMQGITVAGHAKHPMDAKAVSVTLKDEGANTLVTAAGYAPAKNSNVPVVGTNFNGATAYGTEPTGKHTLKLAVVGDTMVDDNTVFVVTVTELDPMGALKATPERNPNGKPPRGRGDGPAPKS